MNDHIKTRKRFFQLQGFDGLKRRRGIMPSDIDGAMDYGGQAFVFLEGKYRDKWMEAGQSRFYANLIKAISYPAILIIYNHFFEDVKQDVDVSKQIVSGTFSNNGEIGRLFLDDCKKQPLTVLHTIIAFEDKYCQQL